MKSFLLICAMCLLGANARLFRGALKSSDQFQGNAHYDHVAKGDVFHHASAGVPTLATTNAHITEDIKLMLAQKLPGLIAATQEIQDSQADTGVLFCGALLGQNHLGVSDIDFYGGEKAASGHDYKDSAVARDGFIASLATLDPAIDLTQCGDNRCLPESMVAKIAGLIRAQGYHIKHADICAARGGPGNMGSLRMCALDPMPMMGMPLSPQYQRAWSCPRKGGVGMQWEYDKQCAATQPTGQCTVHPKTGRIVASDTFLAGKGCTWNWINDIGMDPLYYTTGVCASGTKCSGYGWCNPQSGFSYVPNWPATGPTNAELGFTKHADATDQYCMSFKSPPAEARPAVNQIARTIKYGQVVGRAVDMPDSVIVTGDAGCGSIRGIVLAINGNKLEQKYVLKQHEFATDYWQTQIDETKSIVETIREKIVNLQGLGGLFYPLENSGPFQCNAEFSAFEPNIDAGGPEDPKCDLAGTDYASFQGTPHHKSMAQRSSCFCRSFAGSGDDFYLSTTLSTGKAYCDSTFKETLPSVYSFCLAHKELGEVDEWKAALDELLFSPNDVPTNLDTWFPGASDEIKKNFEDSIAGQGTTCGRVASADPNNVKFSNKGGNCVPINGVQDIVYRLEFEFFNADAAVDRKGSGNTYADHMCVANPSGEQVLSFRQLAYQWQRIYTSNSTGGTVGLYHAEEDVNADTIETSDPKSQFYDDDGNDNYFDFCAVDFAQLLGGGKAYTEAGVKVADPLNYLNRVNGEASYNADLITNELSRVNRESEITWNLFSTSLTQSDQANIVKNIGEKAAGHFMAVLGHDSSANGFSPICATQVGTDAVTAVSNLQGCDQMSILKVENTGDIELGTFAAYKATNLQKTMLKSGTHKYNIKSMALRDNKAQHTILFEGDRYTEGAAAGGVDVTFGPNALDKDARCALLCADGYFDNSTEYDTNGGAGAKDCGTDYDALTTELAGRYCELDRRQYSNDFLSLQVNENTTIDCGRTLLDSNGNSDSKLRIMEFYQGTGCGKLTIGDLKNCDKLSHIYIHTNEDYVLDGPNTAPSTACAAGVDLSGAVFPASVRLIWSDKDSVVDDAIGKVTDFNEIAFGVGAVLKDGINTDNAGELCLSESVKDITAAGVTTLQGQNFSSFDASALSAKSSAPLKNATGDSTYLVGGAFTEGRFTKSCPQARMLILPDSVDHLEDSAVLDLELDITLVDSGNNDDHFVIVAGEKLLKSGNRPDIDPFALFVEDGLNAVIFRRCPTLTQSRDAGTEKVTSLAGYPYGITAEVKGVTDNTGQVPVSQVFGKIEEVIYGTKLYEITEGMVPLSRNIELRTAYDGASASYPPGGTCFAGSADIHMQLPFVQPANSDDIDHYKLN